MAWTEDRIGERFEDIREDIRELRTDIRVFAPVVPQVAGLEEKTDALERDITRLEGAVQRYVNKSVTRQLVIVSTPLFLGAATLILALLTGKVG